MWLIHAYLYRLMNICTKSTIFQWLTCFILNNLIIPKKQQIYSAIWNIWNYSEENMEAIRYALYFSAINFHVSLEWPTGAQWEQKHENRQLVGIADNNYSYVTIKVYKCYK